MPATTSLGIPYPLSTEAPAGHSQMQALATKVDQLLESGFPGAPVAMAVGLVDVTLSAATQGTAAVNFPAGRFSVAPVVAFGVFVGPGGTVPYWVRTTGTASASSITVVVNAPSALTTTFRIWWIAVQMFGGA